MEDETKKRGRGRPKKNTHGGKREGAGRKPGVKVGPYKGAAELLTDTDSFRVTKDTHRRIQELRELTKNDTVPFNRMFEAWVEETAKDYGLE